MPYLKGKLKVGIPAWPGRLLEMQNFRNHLRLTESVFVALQDLQVILIYRIHIQDTECLQYLVNGII